MYATSNSTGLASFALWSRWLNDVYNFHRRQDSNSIGPTLYNVPTTYPYPNIHNYLIGDPYMLIYVPRYLLTNIGPQYRYETRPNLSAKATYDDMIVLSNKLYMEVRAPVAYVLNNTVYTKLKISV